jgi:hypothetical protein
MAAAGANRTEVLLIGFVALLGLMVTLQRNGVLAAWLASAGQGAAYAGLEASLGGPGFGTPRAVEALVRSETGTSQVPGAAARTQR